MQCRGKKKVVKHKTTVGNELIADWHVWVDRISAQKGQKRDWTRSTILCFREPQLAFYKHTSTNWSFTSTYIKDERGSLNLQQASSPRAGGESNPIYGIQMGTISSCCPVPVFASVQIRALRSNCLSLPDTTIYRRPKGLGKKPSSGLNTIITSSTLSLQAALFLQPTHYQCAATYSTHPLPSQRKSPLSLFFFQSPFSMLKLLLAFSYPQLLVRFCVCFVCVLTRTKYTVHEVPFPQLFKEILPTYLIQSPPNKKLNTSPPHTHSPLPIRQQDLPLLINKLEGGTHTDYLPVLSNMLELCLDLQTWLTGLRWTGSSTTWLLQVLAWS